MQIVWVAYMGKPHVATINCKKGCRDGQYFCIPQQEYRKLKLEKLENNKDQ